MDLLMPSLGTLRTERQTMWIYIAIPSGADISEVPGGHLLLQISSYCGSQKLIQGLMSHELMV